MELRIEAKGDKKPSPTMSIEIVRFYAFAAPGLSLARPRSSISTAESGFNRIKGQSRSCLDARVSSQLASGLS